MNNSDDMIDELLESETDEYKNIDKIQAQKALCKIERDVGFDDLHLLKPIFHTWIKLLDDGHYEQLLKEIAVFRKVTTENGLAKLV